MGDKADRIEALAREVLSLTRAKLLVHYRYLDMALFQLKEYASREVSWSTEGVNLYFDPVRVLQTYKKGETEVSRDLLHTLLHCVFRHMMVSPQIDRELWDLCCDVAVEAQIMTLAGEMLPSEKDGMLYTALSEQRRKVPQLTAERLYGYYRNHPNEVEAFERFRDALCRDEHEPWYGDGMLTSARAGSGNAKEEGDTSGETSGDASGEQSEDTSGANSRAEARSNAMQDWEQISRRMQTDIDAFQSKQQGDGAGSMLQALQELHRERYDYAAFLRRFATRHEVMRVSEDEFDYVFYTYGLKLYRDTPIIEPLEYRDDKRISDLVIAIDSSGSTFGPLVQCFLQKTYNILKQEETFLKRFCLHIIQCDADIQEDVVITTQEEFDAYIQGITIKGGGGTDFRPVFKRTDELIAKHTFRNLKGLIYFTDGYGTFPEKKPGYETAFVIVDDDANDVWVPPWAVKLLLRSNEVSDD